MTFEALEIAVLSWAKQKGINNKHTQALKVTEELGELISGVLKDNKSLIKDSIGDLLVTIIILANILEEDPVNCLEIAYKEIRNRKGKTVEGHFIKEEGPNYEADSQKEEILDLLEASRDPNTGAIDKYKAYQLLNENGFIKTIEK